MRGKRVVITGGAGFIGSNIARALCDENEVSVIDDLSTGRLEKIADILERIKFVKGDIKDIDLLRREFESADYVLHQAALPSVQRSVEDPLAVNAANVDGTLNVLIAARDCGVRRVVYASSSAVYGNTQTLPIKESHALRPASPYAVTKLVGEQYCRVFHELYGLETVSLRYFNVFGPGQDPDSEYAAVIPRFISAILNKKQPVVYGDGEQTRDFVYVGDVVRANIMACESSSAVGEAINIATGKPTSLNRLLAVLARVTSRDIEPVYTDPRPGDVKHSVADISLAGELLGYTPALDLEEGLRRMLCYHKDSAITKR